MKGQKEGRGANTERDRLFDAKRREKWSHNNNTALIKQISLFDSALVMTNALSFDS